MGNEAKRRLLPYCVDCGEEDLSKFFYRPDGTRKGNVCKSCANKRIYAKQYNHRDDSRTCPLCGETDTKMFHYKHNGYKNGSLCKACHNKQVHKTRQALPDETKEQVKAEARKRYHALGYKDKARLKYNSEVEWAGKMRRKYGLSLSDYRQMLQEQEGKCAICGNEETRKHQNGKVKRLAVDHSHKTGRVRGLLCQRCNVLLGTAGEDPKVLENAILYLEKSKEDE